MAGLDRSDLHDCHDADPATCCGRSCNLVHAAPTAVLQWLNLTGLIVGLANLELVMIADRAPGKDEAAEPA
jgi:hypothetical protein